MVKPLMSMTTIATLRKREDSLSSLDLSRAVFKSFMMKQISG
jgi:hypothetical protein